MNLTMQEIVAIIVLIAAIVMYAGVCILRFCHITHAAQQGNVKQWLLYAVTEAERELGAGTGRIKLRYVYDLFVVRFPKLSKWITFDQISEWVDDALKELNHLLENNQAVNEYVTGQICIKEEETA